jgi:hypothetical protein
MEPDNPGVAVCRREMICYPTGSNVADMPKILQQLAGLASRLGAGETLGSAHDEGYIPLGIRTDMEHEKPGSTRAVGVEVCADGATITTNIRGRRFIDTVLGIQACERAGIRTTLMTEEEDDENGTAPPLLVYNPEMEAIVSNGAGAVGPFPAVERVLGARKR